MTIGEWLQSGWAAAYLIGVTVIAVAAVLPRWRRIYWERKNKRERERIAQLIRRIKELEAEKGRDEG